MRQKIVTQEQSDYAEGFRAGVAGAPMSFVSAAFDRGYEQGVEERKWRAALKNKAELDRLERAAGNPNPVFAYTDGLPSPTKKD